jgi:hypothetical protein
MTPDIIKQGTVVSVSMAVRVPEDATPDQVNSWLAFEFGASGIGDSGNPLFDYDPDTFAFRIFTAADGIEIS